MQWTIRKLMIATAIAASCMWMYVGVHSWSEYMVAKFECGQGRQIVLWSEGFMAGNSTLHYEVIDNGQVTVPRSYCGRRNFPPCPPSEFSLRTAPWQPVVQVVSNRAPDKPLIEHDFNTNESWPRDAQLTTSQIDALQFERERFGMSCCRNSR